MQHKKPALKLAALVLILLPTLAMQANTALASPGLDGTMASTELINFYSMTTNEVTTFVSLLQTQGMPLFIVRLNAYSEWRSGTSSGITKAKQVIETANNRGIEVAVDLHTWYTTWDSYFRDSASNSATNRATYIKYVKTVLTAFAGSNVYAFMVMNEPQARRATNSENQFILDVIAAAKQVTDKPISVRFMGGYSPSTGHYNSAIDQASDFVCRNTYWDARNPTRTVYGCSEQILLTAINSAHAQNKRFWITEFGKTKTNLEEQRSYVDAFVAWARSEGVDAIFCWVSQPDLSGENYNIFGGYTPYPAFYELTSDDLPPEDELPPVDPPPSPEPTPEPEPSPEPDNVFEDNFESGNLNLWTGTVKSYGETIGTTSYQAHHGDHSVRFAKTGTSRYPENAYLHKSISMQEAYANGYFLIGGSTQSEILTDSGDTAYFVRFSDGSRSLARAGIRRENEIVKWLLYAGGTYVTAPTAVSANRWYNIELHWNPAEGKAEMFIDGTKILQITVDSDYKINPKYVDIGIISAQRVQDQLTLYCDCFKLSTTHIGPEPSTSTARSDVNHDGTINITDLTIVNIAYGSTPESQLWNPEDDVNSDGIIDLCDLVVVISHYGEACT